MTRSPISAQSTEALAPIAQSRPIRTSGPMTAPGPISVPAPISARGPITASGSTITPASSRAVGCTCALAARPWRLEQRRRPQRIGEELARHGDEGRIGMRDLEHRDARRQRRGKARPDQTGAGARRRGVAEIFGIVEEAQIGRARGIERRDIADAAIGRIALAQLGARQRGDLAGRQFAIGGDKIGHPAVRNTSLERGSGRADRAFPHRSHGVIRQNFAPPPKANHCVRS